MKLQKVFSFVSSSFVFSVHILELTSQAGSSDPFFILFVLFPIKAYDFCIRHNTNEELINRYNFDYVRILYEAKIIEQSFNVLLKCMLMFIPYVDFAI